VDASTQQQSFSRGIEDFDTVDAAADAFRRDGRDMVGQAGPEGEALTALPEGVDGRLRLRMLADARLSSREGLVSMLAGAEFRLGDYPKGSVETWIESGARIALVDAPGTKRTSKSHWRRHGKDGRWH